MDYILVLELKVVLSFAMVMETLTLALEEMVCVVFPDALDHL